ncbi:hydantoinase B/oxoprolinase family protein [Martelella alba]|uniref:Hydantoinase B/oxoprolinase family protein n=1 Tax=Martelella alba TaxID=2590451 RepID=A0A506U0N5_9HYPH|nr:hydantoinase B/oxoprolinase family protein [Martelella alba]TPW27330.1 hydantoinase B/oxoprolinase family protein [Martelella alba]
MNNQTTGAQFDPVQLAIMGNRLDAIVREMTNTVILTANSSVIGMARDFSCSILSADSDIVGAAEALPVHAFGSNLQGRFMAESHPDFRQGDAFLNNDPYNGNTHAADHTILVPVFVDGQHMFTTVVKCHQADCGNSVPTTYYAAASDIYAEGALIFPMVRVQRDYQDNDDIVRMCRRRIRVPDQWHGDFKSAIAAARVGERALQTFVEKFGIDTVREFLAAWLDYSERRTAAAITKLPAATLTRYGKLDPLGDFLPDGVDVFVRISIEPEDGMVTVDLRENIDCVDAGVNLCQATATGMAITGVLNCLEHDLPLNSGTFRRIRVLLRENCVVGIPQFPHSCSTATTLLADVICNAAQSSIADLGDGYGLSESNMFLGVSTGVISGRDERYQDAEYVNQLFLMGGGGPASAVADGLEVFTVIAGAGLCYRDSIEITEQRTPLLVKSMRLVGGTAGAGRQRGGVATRTEFGPRHSNMMVMQVTNGVETGPRGVQGGHDALPGANIKVHLDGREEVLPGYLECLLRPGETIVGLDSGGGGYGDPAERDPLRVMEDVSEGYETAERARAIYKVALNFDNDGFVTGVDEAETARLRAA